MLGNILPVASLLGSTFFMLAATGLAGYLLPLRAVSEGWSTLTISLIATGYALAFTASCIITPKLVLRVGHVRVFAVLTALMGISLLLHALIVHPLAWIVFRALAGFSIAGGYMVVESWINEKVTNTSRGAVFSVYMAVSMLALMTGQFLVPLGDPMTAALFMVAAIIYSLSLIPTALSSAQSPQPLTQARFDLKGLYKRSPAALIGSFLAGAVAGQWNNLGPVYAQQSGLSTIEGAAMLATAMIGGAIFQIPLGRYSDRTDRRYVMVFAGGVGFGLSLIAMLAGADDRIVFFATMFLLGSVLFPIYSLNVAHANDYAAPDEFVEVSSGLLIIYGIGSIAGPLMAGPLMDGVGPAGFFAVLGALFAGYAAYAFYRSLKRPPAAEEDRFDFQAMPTTYTPQTFELDPRGDPASYAEDPDGDAEAAGEKDTRQ